jgi:hypothetical protein
MQVRSYDEVKWEHEAGVSLEISAFQFFILGVIYVGLPIIMLHKMGLMSSLDCVSVYVSPCADCFSFQ